MKKVLTPHSCTMLTTWYLRQHPAHSDRLRLLLQKLFDSKDKAMVEIAYQTEMKLCGAAEQYDEMIRLIEEMKERGFQPRALTYFRFLFHLSK